MKNDKNGFDFFLGALAPCGFHGYFQNLAAQPDIQMMLIKSGPGCGKSTLMKQLAQASLAKEQPTERIHCSSDPDSLDGVVFWAKNAAIVDATAPHTLEPSAPGAEEQMVSLYNTMELSRLRQNRAEITELFRACACCQDRASRSLASAASLILDSRRTAAYAVDFDKVRNFGRTLCSRLIPIREGSANGKESFRLLSAPTPKGLTVYHKTVSALADRIVVIEDEYGAVSRVLLEMLCTCALQAGWDVITCWCPLAPEEKIDHLFLPELNLAILTSNSWHPMNYPCQKTIRGLRFADKARIQASRARLRFNRKASAELLEQTYELQSKSLANHNRLEQYYREAVDFSAVDAVRDELLRQLEL